MADQTRGRRSATKFWTSSWPGRTRQAFRSGTLIDDLKKAVAERALVDGGAPRARGFQDAGNHRNATTASADGHRRDGSRSLGTAGAASPQLVASTCAGCRASTTR